MHKLETIKQILKDQVYEPKRLYGNFVNQNVWEPRHLDCKQAFDGGFYVHDSLKTMSLC